MRHFVLVVEFWTVSAPMIKFMLDGNDIELGWVRIIDDTRTSEGKYLKRSIKITDIDLKKPELTWKCQANNMKGYDVSDELHTSYQCKSNANWGGGGGGLFSWQKHPMRIHGKLIPLWQDGRMTDNVISQSESGLNWKV